MKTTCEYVYIVTQVEYYEDEEYESHSRKDMLGCFATEDLAMNFIDKILDQKSSEDDDPEYCGCSVVEHKYDWYEDVLPYASYTHPMEDTASTFFRINRVKVLYNDGDDD